MDSEQAEQLREEMVRDQLRGRGISNEPLLAAMGRIPRELFVPQGAADRAYTDEALPIEAGQTISQPYMVAAMTQLLEAQPGMRVLEIGTGSGYQAAVLAAIGCDVISIERHADLAEAARARLSELGLLRGVRIEVGDGSLGWPAAAPFEGIVVTAAAPSVPATLRSQLADGGRLVVPVGTPRSQELVGVMRLGNAFDERLFGGCVFMPLVGAEGFSAEEAPESGPESAGGGAPDDR